MYTVYCVGAARVGIVCVCVNVECSVAVFYTRDILVRYE